MSVEINGMEIKQTNQYDGLTINLTKNCPDCPFRNTVQADPAFDVCLLGTAWKIIVAEKKLRKYGKLEHRWTIPYTPKNDWNRRYILGKYTATKEWIQGIFPEFTDVMGESGKVKARGMRRKLKYGVAQSEH